MYQGQKWFSLGLLSLLMIFMFMGWVDQVQCQEKYPTRAIDIIVPYSPGGSSDLVPRIIGAYLKNRWAVPLNVVNKPGGNTVPASLEIHQAAPDGYTLMSDCPGNTYMLPLAVKNLPFNVLDRTFIAILAWHPSVIIVPAASPIKSLKDLEAMAKKDPENFTWVSQGGTGGGDFTARQFFKAIGVDTSKTKPIMGVGGGAKAVTLTAGGHVILGSSTVPSALPSIKAGIIRPLAVTSKTRLPSLPDVPTTGEVGYPAVNYAHWNALSGPPKLPSYIVEIWDEVLQEASKDPEVISNIKKIGANAVFYNASEYRELVMKGIEEGAILWSSK